MEQPPIQPRINEAMERLQRFIGGTAVCPFCGGTEWNPARRVVRMLYVDEGDSDPGGEEGDFGGMRTLVLVCAGCSFLRTHVMSED